MKSSEPIRASSQEKDLTAKPVAEASAERQIQVVHRGCFFAFQSNFSFICQVPAAEITNAVGPQSGEVTESKRD